MRIICDCGMTVFETSSSDIGIYVHFSHAIPTERTVLQIKCVCGKRPILVEDLREVEECQSS